MKRATWLNRMLVLNPLKLGLCTTEEQFHAEMKRLRVPRDDWPKWISSGADGATHFFERASEQCSIVCVRIEKKRDQLEVYGLLVHEAVHVWQEVCRVIREQSPSAEFEAYSIQGIAQALMAAYRDHCRC